MMRTNEITFRQIDAASPNIGEVADVYADVFAGSEWNEYTKCPIDGKYYGMTTTPGELSACCEAPLGLAYPRDETADYIRRELSRPAAYGMVLEDDGCPVGFSWAFAYDSPEILAAEKYKTDEMRTRVVQVLGEMGVTGALYYLSETGIINNPLYRGRGYSNIVYQRRLERARELGLPAVQRTTTRSRMYDTSRTAGMTQIIGPLGLGSAEQFAPSGEVARGGIDSEMSERVLFVNLFDKG